MTPQDLLDHYGPRESTTYDVAIVGAGPAGLATAIRLKQLAAERGGEISVVVLEKGSEPGAHILSGAVMDPRALDELIPDWKERGAPLHQPVTADEVLLLSETGAWRTPAALVPHNFHNAGNYVVSLGKVVRWLAAQAEALGVDIFPGFAAAEVLYNEDGAVKGVATGNMGIGRDGAPGADFQLGMELHAGYTVFAEGARGQLGRQLLERFRLQDGKAPQSFGIGIKELWEIPAERARPGLVVHTAGWPMDTHTFGGGFLYHLENNQVALGFVVGLDYRNPWLSPFEEMQRWKQHPAIRRHIEGSRRLGYGARAINNGGIPSLPKTVFPGGALVGCDAGYLNASRIKGSHAAIKSGMLAAEAIHEALAAGRSHDELAAYPAAFERSWLYRELRAASNFKPWFKKGRTVGMLMAGIEHWLLPRLGIATPPWTLRNPAPDHSFLAAAADCPKIDYPKPDGRISFDRLSSVFLSNTNHAENQPAHLTLKDADVPLAINRARYAGPEARYCPAGVYEFVADDAGRERLQINAQNCVHCKTCDIKDPTQNIVWCAPEGGGGPNYTGL
ncbi:electron transfer flavoprotein-ubiquinone oxidoreductase [Azoarcus olearius]|uniref:electron transfer flavoprotein-ubiquinone oxidoreductase n=1 Tax=Azoarcus sp. (strain BH72) TaxID=418699 RepID=UPI00080610A7|nr:electron transfer flavoprotein-ubiquinone oxidoreductase [Azoarcus olearius]ANQ86172.1 electron transfer flavoprotein-ubiquinone oxidoreductase [Azoarcus olearius]